MDNQTLRPNLLDVPISIFADTYKKQPEDVTTLRRITTTGFYKEPIEVIRQELDEHRQKDLKKKLRAFTPVALLNHRTKGFPVKEQVNHQWPLLMGDIDQQDNPDVDMNELKRHIARLPYVVLCSYSVRGGVWFVARLPDGQTPETLVAHFRYLQRLFSQKFGIALDGSKGNNPTHLRYVSYDAEPYFNEAAGVMSGQYTPPPIAPRNDRPAYRFPSGEFTRNALQRCVRLIEDAPDGQKHAQLNRAAFTAGGHIAGGVLDEADAITALEDAIRRKPNVADVRAADRTIRDGIRDGKQQPIYAEPATSVVPKTGRATFKRESSVAKSDCDPIIVSIIADHRVNPGSILRPTESQLERLTLDSCDTYPVEWDEPTPPNAVPMIKPMDFFDWQRKYPPFNRLGLASQQPETQL
ncbi:BT4734/BF3469 family protein [Spirosoma areae]